jgi:eukaryotic-like serine/threonine-protein kinase
MRDRMSLTPGAQLGPYEILSALGAGGMGEVYKARDTRLERTVAIKVLPAGRAASPEVRQRFEREAKTISQLSHPHICALYDVGREGEIEYLVIEYLEGETLAQRLEKGPLAQEQVLRYAVEIADALDRAHRQGIVHRDLKPGNVMLTQAGVKLLDFGLAKAIGPSGTGHLTALPTQANLTQEGTILGTVQYMAPEQLEGKEADARTDIFAFGAVLHEMATGRRAFSGATHASLISSILRDEPPPISQAQPMSPLALDRMVAVCLAKNPDERWQSARDIVRELRWIAGGGQQPPLRPAEARGHMPRAAFAVAGFAVGALAAGLMLWPLLRRPPAVAVTGPVWLSMDLPAGMPPATYGAQRPVFAPDGSRVVYAGSRGGTTRLYMRSLDTLEVRPVRESEGANSAFFSPDSRWLGFATGSSLVKVPVEGGVPQAICDASEVRGASWGPDGMIVFATGTSGLRRVPAAGGTSEEFLKPDRARGESGFYWPTILPDGEAVLFTSFHGVSHVAVASLKTGQRHDLIEGTDPQYAASGHLVFGRGGSLFAAPFDTRSLTLAGPAISVVEEVMVLSPYSCAQFGLSAGGALVYTPGTLPRHSLVKVDRQGKVEPLPYGQRGWEEPRVSPDGKRLAVSIREGDPDVWILDLVRGTLARLTFEPGEDETPNWTPDGLQVTYNAGRPDSPDAVFRRSADGSGAEERIFETEQHVHTGSWSPDGRTFAYSEYDPANSGDIWVLTIGAKDERRPWLRTPFNERAPRFSPDGRWLLYVSNESGRDDVYVQAFPGPGGKWQISTAGGTEPVWSRDGREIFYRSEDRMMAARVLPGGTFSVETPRVLFEGHFVPTRRGEAAYDVLPDGQQFLMVQPDERSVPTHLNLVLQFSEELKRRAPPTSKP